MVYILWLVEAKKVSVEEAEGQATSNKNWLDESAFGLFDHPRAGATDGLIRLMKKPFSVPNSGQSSFSPVLNTEYV